MSVYVDDMQTPATIRGHRARCSHLYADSSAELLEFARLLELKGTWLQRSGTFHEHFDVTETVRKRAILAGAVPITCVQSGQLLMQKMLRSRAA